MVCLEAAPSGRLRGPQAAGTSGIPGNKSPGMFPEPAFRKGMKYDFRYKNRPLFKTRFHRIGRRIPAAVDYKRYLLRDGQHFVTTPWFLQTFSYRLLRLVYHGFG